MLGAKPPVGETECCRDAGAGEERERDAVAPADSRCFGSLPDGGSQLSWLQRCLAGRNLYESRTLPLVAE